MVASGNYYILVNKATGKVMDLQGASTVNETNIQVYPSNNTDAQLFKLVRVTDGIASYYSIEPKLTPGKLVSVEGNGITGNNVKIYDDLHNSKQRFWLRRETDGYYLICHIFTLKCLTAQN
ncbi:MAG: RICIN domain-containing protein [Muricomes sp.]